MGVFVASFFEFGIVWYFGYLFFLILGTVFLYVNRSTNAKTPLKYTARIKRLVVTLSILWTVLTFCTVFFVSIDFSYIFVGLLPLLILPICMLAIILNNPIETSIQNKFIKQAKHKLSRQIIVVGITGSYGKTTAKNILSDLLSVHFKVCASPSNYNTPMGICKTINQTLKDDDQVLILEMGARYKNDIKQLIEIAKLDYCMITSVGDCHLETFGSIDTVVETKCDIVLGLKENGIAIACGDDDRVVNRLKSNPNVIFVNGDDDLFRPIDIGVSKQGTTWIQSIDGTQVQLSTVLLGQHIPNMVSMCIALAIKMGLTTQQIIEGVKHIRQVEHRLQLLQSTVELDTVVIDDSYNANENGIKSAVDVLSKFDGYKKVIITPGIVELGKNESRINQRIGNIIAPICDFAILVGSRAKYIQDGIKEHNDCNCNVILVKNREEAVGKLQSITSKKVVLFCNDLPDNIV